MDYRAPVVGNFEAFWGGFSSFFSIWQACVLQISPFFMVYIVGLYLAGFSKENSSVPAAKEVILPSIAYMAGFSVLYSLLSSPGLSAGRALTSNISNLRMASGIYILLVSVYIILAGRAAFLAKINKPVFLGGLSLFIGIAFAMVYSPCITPTLSDILGVTILPGKAVPGSILAFLYGLGLSLAFAVTGFILVLLLKKTGIALRNPRLIKDICGAVLAVLALLNITGFMVYYKAFFLGLLV